ncbi:MAG: hypothetical protein IH840_12415 [Candidatus Heimdallarchaeota archaeon]|nr:hypothetical protein [Candidatus Heimdallarchaeota archaeon]
MLTIHSSNFFFKAEQKLSEKIITTKSGYVYLRATTHKIYIRSIFQRRSVLYFVFTLIIQLFFIFEVAPAGSGDNILLIRLMFSVLAIFGSVSISFFLLNPKKLRESASYRGWLELLIKKNFLGLNNKLNHYNPHLREMVLRYLIDLD